MLAPTEKTCTLWDRPPHIFSQNEETAGIFNANLHVNQHEQWVTYRLSLPCMMFPSHLFRLRERVHILNKKTAFNQLSAPVICPQCKTELWPLGR